MLKSIDTSRTLSGFVRRKCADVFMESENTFSFLCNACQLKSFEFDDFVLHLRNVHMPDAYEADLPGPYKSFNYTETGHNYVNATMDNEDSDEEPLPMRMSSEMFMGSTEIGIIKEEPGLSENEDFNADSDEEPEDEDYTPQLLKKPPAPEKTPKAKPPHIMHPCNQCEKSYKFASNLQRHMATHLPNAPRPSPREFICRVCGKQLAHRKSLYRHEEAHNTERKFACDIEGCEKRFPTTRGLYDHKNSFHFRPKNFVCETCGYSTRTQGILEVHIRSHTGERPFECEICGKRFASKRLLIEHGPMHSAERPFECDVCKKTFSRSKALYHHKFLHTGEKKFVCKLCGSAYAQMSGLSAHMRKHREENNVLQQSYKGGGMCQ